MRSKVLLLVLMLAMAAMIMMPLDASAAITGKMSGKVIDEETGEPLPGVAVSVVGTRMGALSDENGEYIILNVPVSTYTIKASLIGFAEVEVSDVAVSAELTSYTDFSLSKKALELGRVIRVKAERPLVLKDKTTTVQIVTSEDMQSMPVRTFADAVSLQNSVVRMKTNVDVRQRGARAAAANSSELNLRGGRPQEVAYYIDGFSQQDPLTGLSTSNLSKNSIKEVSVTSGVFDAEYGHVASGIVNVVTNSGSEVYHGNLELLTDNLVSESYDHNYYNADVSGPIPGLEDAFFFVSAERRFLRDRDPSIKTEELFNKYEVVDRYEAVAGADAANKFPVKENPWRLPANSLSGWSGQAKLDFALTNNVKLALTGNASIDWWQEYRHAWLFNYEHNPRYRDKNWGLNGKVTHTFGENAYYNLSASYFYTERYAGDGVNFMSLNNYERAYTNPEWDDNNIFREWFDTTSVPGDTVQSYFTTYTHREASYYGLKGDVNKQFGSHHTVRAGFDFQLHSVRQIQVLGATQGFNYNRYDNFGYDSLGRDYDGDDYRTRKKTPNNLGVFLQDRFEWRGLIISGGVRFDRFDYNTLRIKDLQNPLDPENLTGVDTLDPGDLADSRVFTKVSPRMGIAFPVSDKTQLHINYGKFFQRPNLNNLYINYRFMAARIGAGSYYPFASPNLEPEKITQYEAGITHQLGVNTAFGITAYYKDIQDQTQIFHQSPASPFVYDFYSNTDYGTVKGVDFNLVMRRTRNIKVNLNYTLSWATGTGSYDQTFYNIAWKNPQGTPKITNPLDYDQRHNITGVLDIRTVKGEGPLLGKVRPLENLSINAIVKMASGTPYTPTNPYDAAREGISVNQEPTGGINSVNLPWSTSVDLKVERRFNVGQYTLTPYVWVQNLFNSENVFLVYEGTGEPNTTGWLSTVEGEQWAATNDESLYRMKEENPKNYGRPRIVYVGMRMSF